MFILLEFMLGISRVIFKSMKNDFKNMVCAVFVGKPFTHILDAPHVFLPILEMVTLGLREAECFM